MQSIVRVAAHAALDNGLRRIPLTFHRGPAGTMLVAGEDRWTRYLPDRFFGAGPRTRESLGVFRAWQLPRVLRQWRDAADITVARVDLLTARRFPESEYLRVPEWVRMVAPVPAAGQRFASKSAHHDVALIRQRQLTWRVSHDSRDLEIHLDRDYYPYTRLRHGDDSFVWPRWRVRQAFRRGGLLLVEREGAPIAGLVFACQPPTLMMLTIACANADPALLKHGGLAAIYFFSFECARTLSLTAVDMRGCRPCVKDNLFFVKRKYGGLVEDKPDAVYDWLVCWKTASPAVTGFLHDSPLIVRDRNAFAVVHAADDAALNPDRLGGVTRLLAVKPGAPFGDWA